MNFTCTVDYTDFQIVFNVFGFSPARPAPACSDPDSPRFSDCGEDEEVDRVEAFIVFQESAKRDQQSQKCSDSFSDFLIKKYWDAIREKADELSNEI